ncbi:hypothetical protein AVEN_80403-1 [Araneus ventricosus]|uniref:Uncharacterized protein n=1 Tax=Araneus ventricosus TaxID=182803 RepID=A0A4Y2SK28_ARAVE|nr:hypothetical protein AVEN_80403-1 [Araneus ventricosus]
MGERPVYDFTMEHHGNPAFPAIVNVPGQTHKSAELLRKASLPPRRLFQADLRSIPEFPLFSESPDTNCLPPPTKKSRTIQEHSECKGSSYKAP